MGMFRVDIYKVKKQYTMSTSIDEPWYVIVSPDLFPMPWVEIEQSINLQTSLRELPEITDIFISEKDMIRNYPGEVGYSLTFMWAIDVPTEDF